MEYKKLIRKIAHKNNVPVAEIEREMKYALKCSGLKCSPKEFIEITATLILNKDYI